MIEKVGFGSGTARETSLGMANANAGDGGDLERVSGGGGYLETSLRLRGVELRQIADQVPT